jgi:hypothetical protein
LSEREIVEDQERAFKVQFRRPLRRLFWWTVGAQLVAIFSHPLHLDGEDLFLLSSFIWGPMIWTWSDYRVATSLGMRHALRENSHTRAMLRTFAEIVVFPWAPFFPVLFWMATHRFSEEAAGCVTFAWAIGGAIYQAVRARRERARMIREFRTLVAGDGEGVQAEGRRFAMVWNAVRMLRGGTGSLARS